MVFSRIITFSLAIILISCSTQKVKSRNPAQFDWDKVSSFVDGPKKILAIRQSLFYKELLRSQQIFSNPDIDNDIKSAQMSDLFKQLESTCVTNCDSVIKTLEVVNTDIGAKSAKEIFKKIQNDTPVIGQIADESNITKIKSEFLSEKSDLIKDFTAKLKAYLKSKDKKFIAAKLGASVQLLRYIIALEEELYFDLSSKKHFKTHSSFTSVLSKSIGKYKKQFEAIYEIYRIIKPDDKAAKVDFSDIPIETVQKVAQNINELGLFYIKFAQSISNNKMILTKEQQKVFKVFQDDLEPMESEDVLKTIHKEFGKPASEIFIDFNPDDYLATGSIAQVYKTKIKTVFGVKEVIVKVQRQGLEEVIKDNKKLNHVLLGLGKLAAPIQYAPFMDLATGVMMGIEKAFERELDFKEEAQNMARFRNYFKFSNKTIVPKVVEKYSGQKVITMEVIRGENVDDAWESMEMKLRETHSKELFNNILDSFLYQIFITKNIHGDMHPGNILVEGQKLGLIDFGQVFKSKGMITAPIKLWWNFMMGNLKGVEKALLSLGDIGGELGPSQEMLKDFRLAIKESMKKSKIEKVRFIKPILKRELKGEFQKIKYNFSLDQLKNFGDLFVNILREGHFHPKPTYVQFFRSGLPIASTLYAIGKDIPLPDMKKILLRRMIMLYPAGYLKYFSSYTLRAHKDLPKLFKKFVSTAKLGCSSLLNNIASRKASP